VPAAEQQVTVDGRSVRLSRLDKALYPSGFTKAQVIEYYIRIAPHLLPHFRNRPVTLKRFPDGVAGQAFYEKDAPKYTPEWVKTWPVPRRNGGPDIRYVVINDPATLVWCANIASLELHPFLHTAPHLRRPQMVVFDLDPGPPADIFSCAEVAFHIKGWLDRRHLKSFVKVSGSKGLQLYVPLNSPVTYDQSRGFAHTLAETFERQYPDLCVSKMEKSLRAGKVFIDWSQNADFKTTIGVYSLRAKADEPFVSAPVSWRELRTALRNRNRNALFFSPAQTVDRVEATGDLFAPLLEIRQELPATGPKTAGGDRVRANAGS
jgi:bifunctional non-homologous end joining protein LigD